MRRPVGVKWVLLCFRWTRFFSGRVSRCRHPSIRTLVSDLGSLGASWAFSFQPVLPPDYRPALPSFRWRLGQAIDAVTGTRLWALAFPFLGRFGLCCRRHRALLAVVQRFVCFSAHPQVMQQHRELSRGCDDGSLLATLAAALSQLQPPAPQIAVDTEWPQNVLRPCTSRVRR